MADLNWIYAVYIQFMTIDGKPQNCNQRESRSELKSQKVHTTY